MTLSSDSYRDDVSATPAGIFEYELPAKNIAWKAGEVVGMNLSTGIAAPLDAGLLAIGVVPEASGRDLTAYVTGTERIRTQSRTFAFPQTTSQFAVDAAAGLPVFWDSTANTAVNTSNSGANAFLGDLVRAPTTDVVHVDVRMANSLRHRISSQLALTAGAELTIASGAATVTNSLHTVDNEADAASDNLDTLSGSVANQLYLVKPANAARTVVIRDKSVSTTGNLFTPFGQSISLAEVTDWALLVSDGTNLTVIGFCTLAANGGGAGAIIGLLSALNTTDKASVIAAINEVQVPVAQILTSRTASVGAKLVLAEGANNGAHTVTVAAPSTLAGNVVVTLPAGDLDLNNVPGIQAFDLTLVSGTATNNTTVVIAARSEVIVDPVGAITGTTNFACTHEVVASRVPGAAGVGVVVVNAKGADGNIDADAAGVVRVKIFTPPV